MLLEILQVRGAKWKDTVFKYLQYEAKSMHPELIMDPNLYKLHCTGLRRLHSEHINCCLLFSSKFIVSLAISAAASFYSVSTILTVVH